MFNMSDVKRIYLLCSVRDLAFDLGSLNIVIYPQNKIIEQPSTQQDNVLSTLSFCGIHKVSTY